MKKKKVVPIGEGKTEKINISVEELSLWVETYFKRVFAKHENEIKAVFPKLKRPTAEEVAGYLVEVDGMDGDSTLMFYTNSSVRCLKLPEELAMIVGADAINRLANLKIFKKTGYAQVTSVSFVKLLNTSSAAEESIDDGVVGENVEKAFSLTLKHLKSNPSRKGFYFRYKMSGSGSVNDGVKPTVKTVDEKGNERKNNNFSAPKHYGATELYESPEQLRQAVENKVFIDENKIRGCHFPVVKILENDSSGASKARSEKKNLQLLIETGVFFIRGNLTTMKGESSYKKRSSLYLSNADAVSNSAAINVQTSRGKNMDDDTKENSYRQSITIGPSVEYTGVGGLNLSEIEYTIVDDRYDSALPLSSKIEEDSEEELKAA